MKTYEELRGAQGRQMYYRAERYKARDLFRKALPELALDETPYTLQDISLNGLGATTPSRNAVVCNPGMPVAVQLGIHGIPLFAGRGEIARTEQAQGGTRIGIRLHDCLDISGLVAKYREALIRSDIDGLAGERVQLGVPTEYRLLAADLLHLLRAFRANLEQFEGDVLSAASEADILGACEERILPVWRDYWHRANAIVAPIMDDPLAFKATKRFTELVLTPDFVAGAIWRRSYEKPLGYPGDFQIMSMVYDWRREGAKLYDKLMHRLGLEVAECIATRMFMMRHAIAETVLRVPRHDGRAARVASLGCGPAREVVDYLTGCDLPRPAHFTLIDQDHQALSSAYERTYPAVARMGGRAAVTCLNASFLQLMKGELFDKLPPQDLIYTVGLIDYLADKRVKALIATLYGNLAPGGQLIVGNMHKTPGGNLWPMEFLTDWNIIYRDADEMRALAADMAVAQPAISYDSTGRVVLVTLTKPAA